MVFSKTETKNIRQACNQGLLAHAMLPLRSQKMAPLPTIIIGKVLIL